MVEPAKASVVVCGIVRDAEKGLRRNIPVINDVVAKFADYRIVMIENDSKDDTKQLLADWVATDEERIIAVMEDTNAEKSIPTAKESHGANPFFCHKRIDKMARLRNRYMDKLASPSFADTFMPDYLIVVDMDVAQLYGDAIMTTFEKKDVEWDAVCAFGYSTSPKLKRRYHDTYALTLWGEQDKPQTEQMIKEYADKYGRLTPHDEWVRVASGFGGLTIYRYEAVEGLRYAEPAIENDDARVEVRCEHFSLYKQMIERGYDRFYINPAMVLKYQDLTLQIVWKSFKRIFGF